MGGTQLDEIVAVDISGPLHVARLADGWYAVGMGMLIPCRDRDEALAIVDDMKTNGNGNGTQGAVGPEAPKP
jgi:hypothetical protein